MLMQAWSDTMAATALLVAAVLLVRKPFARRFGPGLTYALWAIPALRFILPPLPFAEAVPASTLAESLPAGVVTIEAADAAALAAASAPAPASWTLAEALPFLFALWLAGMLAVLARALAAHRRFKAEVLAAGVELEAIGRIRLVMTEAVDGPVAFGLRCRFVAVPRDFFARYAADERALAIDHELAHHRHGDLWANAAALLLLASQWFNPFAWRAIRAFRFDQEAACDARVLTMEGADGRTVRTARYATAIAKAAVGTRLSLAAPMAVQDNLQERLTMLMRQDISRKRSLAGRLLIGGAAIGLLAATATLVPAATASAGAQADDVPAPPASPAPPAAGDMPAPPAPPAPPAAPAPLDGTHSLMIFTSEDDGEAPKDGAERREVTRVVVRHAGDGEGEAPEARRFEFRMPGGLSRDDILATLKEQGISGARAEAIADKLEAKRRHSFHTALAPLPPMPPVPPVPPIWSAADGKAMALGFGTCAGGAKPAPIVDRSEGEGKKHSRVLMLACGDGPEAAAQLSALKKARERFAEAETAHGMSDAMRAKVIADMDRAIADLEKRQH